MRWAFVVFALLLCRNFQAEAPGAAPVYDVLIANGRVLDGSGSPAVLSDVAIQGDTIAAVGRMPDARAALRIDARGMHVAPGFIDIHTHARHGIFDVPTAENYIRQGVTTVIEGQDGNSPIPLRPFLARLADSAIAVNFGMLAGQGSIREAVMGLEARQATAAEMAKMCELMRQAMLDGAFGISTGLLYVPGNYTPIEEIIELARVAGRMGGIHISHMRDEAAGVAESVRETIRIGEESGLPTQITHHKVVGKGNWGASRTTLRLVEEARARGVDVSIDQYPYTASSTSISALFPPWALAGGQAALIRRLADPAQRAKIKAGIVDRLTNDRGGGDPKNVVIARCWSDDSLTGKSLADILAARGIAVSMESAAETVIELQSRGGCQAIFHAMAEEDVIRIMTSPHTMIASDGEVPIFGSGSPHPRSYGTFARVLGQYVREKKVLPLEEAVRKMTFLPAARLRLADRGLLRPGMKADVVVFDAETVADRATFLHPHQYATGFSAVLVNGRPVILNGKLTANRPGRVLWGPAAHARLKSVFDRPANLGTPAFRPD
ncbi:MAG: N-acyl-D-amino-acid deacylase family protein [Rhodospirillales bacterium]